MRRTERGVCRELLCRHAGTPRLRPAGHGTRTERVRHRSRRIAGRGAGRARAVRNPFLEQGKRHPAAPGRGIFPRGISGGYKRRSRRLCQICRSGGCGTPRVHPARLSASDRGGTSPAAEKGGERRNHHDPLCGRGHVPWGDQRRSAYLRGPRLQRRRSALQQRGRRRGRDARSG